MLTLISLILSFDAPGVFLAFRVTSIAPVHKGPGRASDPIQMKIAIAGTHCSGKSILIEEFLERHGDYIHEPEPYEALHELLGESFAAEPGADDFLRQLEYQVERLRQYRQGDRVIFERSPLDFVAYLMALTDLRRETADERITEAAIGMAKKAATWLDAIVFLRAGDVEEGSLDEEEDLILRRAVDVRLEDILMDDELRIFDGPRPAIQEVSGTTSQRLQIVEAIMG
jgi:hypothetical protein